MQQIATDSGVESHELSPTQQKALSALGEGATITAAADAAGVDRTTVHRWPREDFAFQADWNRLRAEIRKDNVARIEHLADSAFDAVRTAIEEGDARIAVTVLKGIGLLDGQTPSISDDPAILREEADLAKLEADYLRMMRRRPFLPLI